MEEPWDELMGPPPNSSQNNSSSLSSASSSTSLLRSHGSGISSAPPPVRSFASSASAPPPASMFATNNRWNESGSEAEAAVTTSRAAANAREVLEDNEGHYEDDEEDYESPPILRKGSLRDEVGEEQQQEQHSLTDADRIRQEALYMLEVCDDQLSDSPYSIRRTITGGYSATTNNNNSRNKRIPKALAGLQFQANRSTSRSSRFRDDPSPGSSTNSKMTREDFEYGDEDIVDVVGMEMRSATSRPAESGSSSNNNNWSSRYSVDHTLLALSGGSLNRSSSYEETSTISAAFRNNLFANSPTKSSQIFGNGGFEFRKNHVFGKQYQPKTATNLKAAWTDAAGGSSLPEPNPRTKSWQEQLLQKRRQRRYYIVCAVMLFVFIVTIGSVMSKNKKESSAAAAAVDDTKDPQESVTFYITSDVPYDAQEEEALRKDWDTYSSKAQFLVHLGNIQDSEVTLCAPAHYEQVADMLRECPIPTFILPGQEDWADCADPEEGWDAWYDNFKFFDLHWKTDFTVSRQMYHWENFAFLQSGVLFIGIHLVGGTVVDAEFNDRRNIADYNWIHDKATQHKNDARAIVIFGNAPPGLAQNKDFFQNTTAFIGDLGLPTAYIHANTKMGMGGSTMYQPNKAVPNFYAFQSQDGGEQPSLRVTVGFGDQPFILG